MLSQDEAISFVQEVLQLSSAWEQRKENPKQFIRHLLKAYITTIPFQSATLISTPPEARQRPSLEEIKEFVLSGKGGMCYVMNVFLKYLLDALGYNTFFVAGAIYHPNNHILVVIVDLEKPGDKYLVDGGLGYPTFDPISLDFEQESPTYSNSYMMVHVTRDVDSLVMNFQYRFKDSLNHFFPPGVKTKVCKIDATPRELEYFDKWFDDVYKNPNITPFHRSLRVCGYSKPEGKASIVKDSGHLCEDSSHCLQETKIGSADLLDLVGNSFPMLKIDAKMAIERLCIYN